MIETMINMAGAFRRHAAGPKFRPAAAMLACSLVTGAVGFGTGAAIGSVLIGDFIKGGGRIVPLLYRPSFQHIDAAAMLGSADDLKRLSGYYALLETGSVDVGFLVERYGMESSIVTRRTIVWILGFAQDRRTAFDAYTELYREAPASVRAELLCTLKRLDGKRYLDFIKDHDIATKTVMGE